MDLGLHGARAVVSGASRGIGLAIAHAYDEFEARAVPSGRFS